MRLDSAGLPFIGGALALALLSGAFLGWIAAAFFIALAVILLVSLLAGAGTLRGL